MPRRREVKERSVPPDSRYNNYLVAKFINCLMRKGKKSVAETIFYSSLDLIEKKTKQPPLGVFTEAIDRTKPVLEVRSRRVGGATYQIPVEVGPDRRNRLAIRWIIDAARSQKGLPTTEKLARELMDAAKGEGAAVKKKENTHRMAEANRAFAHYRW
ncbi:30S ribosomal protein S7 [candidate division NPL-UPA2 bacterium Unc8]|uniref:Small ribosomal subunit protein uS7 n=1 Tax=candidate division NPL-UPA2 bacterium Unc8 TaxID=1980939 RepID=A0A399FWC2_UNCN2|nr:30S ribosomal protein S7 [Bacillota bacterium]MBT9146482.1 30S ribosomal protein S7 [Bacillota bacterium]RII00307.1 MAG: 30S ribosomal protein S7 [candidate division NPL-UPA2 bacterium Unc8]